MVHFFPCTPDCPDRTPGCHGYCKRYKEKRAEWDKRKAQEKIDQGIKNYVCDGIGKSRDENAKKRRGRLGIKTMPG